MLDRYTIIYKKTSSVIIITIKTKFFTNKTKLVIMSSEALLSEYKNVTPSED